MLLKLPKIIFYEKSGCAGNQKQKKLLSNHGIAFEVKNILEHKWTKESLLLFVNDVAKEDMINPFAPNIKNGLIDIKKYTKEELLVMMVKDPILIKRPLIEIGKDKLCGFDIAKINSFIPTNILYQKDLDNCSQGKSCTHA